MPFTIYVRMKRPGKQKKEDLLPVPFDLENRPDTVKELLTMLVELGVREYNERKDKGQLVRYLTKEEIRDQASARKISFGVRGGNDADVEEAAENALQCFLDGIYRIFAGEEELTELDQQISWKEDLVFTFIRLTMLSGW